MNAEAQQMVDKVYSRWTRLTDAISHPKLTWSPRKIATMQVQADTLYSVLQMLDPEHFPTEA